MTTGPIRTGRQALLLGAGGAGSAIAVALLEAGVRGLVIHDTNDARAAALVDLVSDLNRGQVTTGPPDPTGCDLVCNATPLGTDEGDPLPVDSALLTSTMFVGDVIAGHGRTPLLRAAQAAGCATANGGDMVEAGQEVMADFLLHTPDNGPRARRTTFHRPFAAVRIAERPPGSSRRADVVNSPCTSA